MPRRSAPALAAGLFCAACASTPESTAERDAWAKEFEPLTRDSVIYVYRPDPWVTTAVTELFADDRLIGSSLPGTYFRIPVLPGRHVIETFAGHGPSIEVETRGTEVVFLELRSYSGTDGSPNMRFRRVSPEGGKRAILDCCARLEIWRPGQPRLLW